MGVITISMDNSSEKMLRELAKRKYGNKKNAISQTIIDSLNLHEQKKEDASSRLKKRLENPISFKKTKIVKEKRSTKSTHSNGINKLKKSKTTKQLKKG